MNLFLKYFANDISESRLNLSGSFTKQNIVGKGGNILRFITNLIRNLTMFPATFSNTTTIVWVTFSLNFVVCNFFLYLPNDKILD